MKASLTSRNPKNELIFVAQASVEPLITALSDQDFTLQKNWQDQELQSQQMGKQATPQATSLKENNNGVLSLADVNEQQQLLPNTLPDTLPNTLDEQEQEEEEGSVDAENQPFVAQPTVALTPEEQQAAEERAYADQIKAEQEKIRALHTERANKGGWKKTGKRTGKRNDTSSF